jgi:phospholipid N-methyltransferase
MKKILEKIKYRFLRRNKFKNFLSIKLLRSKSDNGSYSIAVEEALTNKKKFNNFKSNIFYQVVLEHVSYPQGLEYLNIIKRDSNLIKNIDKFLINDQIGNPKKYYYEELKTKISPTTLRYIKVASDIKKIFKDEITDIVEIGCGYGGQYLILDQVMKINHYILMDLPNVNKLIDKYLEHHSLNSSYETKTIDQLQSNKQFDLVISNYAFSELPPQTQISYIKKILLKSKNGYLTMNSGKENSVLKKHLLLEEIKNYIKDITILEEEPNTYEGNYIIIWGNIKI